MTVRCLKWLFCSFSKNLTVCCLPIPFSPYNVSDVTTHDVHDRHKIINRNIKLMMCRMVSLIIELKQLLNRMEKDTPFPLIYNGDFCRFWIKELEKIDILKLFSVLMWMIQYDISISKWYIDIFIYWPVTIVDVSVMICGVVVSAVVEVVRMVIIINWAAADYMRMHSDDWTCSDRHLLLSY